METPLHRDPRIAATLALWKCAAGSPAVNGAQLLFENWDGFEWFFDTVLPPHARQFYPERRYSDEDLPIDFAFILSALVQLGIRRGTLKHGAAYIRGTKLYSYDHPRLASFKIAGDNLASVLRLDGDYVLTALSAGFGDLDGMHVFKVLRDAALFGIPAGYLAALDFGTGQRFLNDTDIRGLYREGVPGEYARSLYLWKNSDIISFWENGISAEYIHQLPVNGLTVEPTDIALLHREGIPAAYAAACLDADLDADTIIDCHERGLAAEYAGALHV